MNSTPWILLLIFVVPQYTWGKVRKVEVKTDQIVTVKTAVGIATIIQVPERPTSLVVGDQSGFKVEYLDQAITIKPVYGGARSNLYIYTDFRRFNVQLITTNESSADYVVYLENPKQKVESKLISWMKFRNHQKNDGIFLETKRLAKTKDGILSVEFEITSDTNEIFKPEWIWLTQSGKTRSIHNLAFSGQSLNKGERIQGIMQILRSDISDIEPLKFELRRKKNSYLSLPKVTSWK
jgi:hypothetical protein